MDEEEGTGHTCALCKGEAEVTDYCAGCKSYICAECELWIPPGPHQPEDHLEPEEEEEEDDDEEDDDAGPSYV